MCGCARYKTGFPLIGKPEKNERTLSSQEKNQTGKSQGILPKILEKSGHYKQLFVSQKKVVTIEKVLSQNDRKR